MPETNSKSSPEKTGGFSLSSFAEKLSDWLFYSNNSNNAAMNPIENEQGVDDFIAGFSSGSNTATFEESDSPDKLISSKGLGVFTSMMTDGTVYNSVMSKCFNVISGEWDIIPYSNDTEDLERAAFIKYALNNMRGSVVGSTLCLLKSSLKNGYSVNEIVAEALTDGEYAGRWGLKFIKSRNPQDYKIELDKFNNLVGLSVFDGGIEKKLNIDNFFIYTYNPDYSRIWGTSDLRAAYRHWWSKKFLINWMNVHYERHGSPTRMAKIPRGRKTDQENVLNALKAIKNNSCFTIPEDVDVQFIMAGKADYVEAIKYHDEKIEQAIKGETLTSGTGGDGGKSNALGNVHQQTKEDYTTFLRRDLSETVFRECIIRRIVFWNYGVTDRLPTLIWQPRKDVIKLNTVLDVVAAQKLGILVNGDRNQIRQSMGLPKVTMFDNSPEEIWIPSILDPGAIGTTTNIDISGDSSIGEEIEEEKVVVSDGEKIDKQSDNAINSNVINIFQNADIDKWNPSRSMMQCEDRLGGKSYYQSEMKRRNNYELELADLYAPILQKMQAAIQKYVKKNIIDNPRGATSGAMDGIKLVGISDLRSATRKWIGSAAINEYLRGFKETNRNRDGVPQSSDFSMLDIDINKHAISDISITAGPPVQAIEKVKKWKENGDFESIKKWRIGNAKNIAGTQQAISDIWVTDIVETEILKGVKSAIIIGLEAGADESTAMMEIRRVFEKFGSNPKLVEPNRLRTIARTNITRAVSVSRRQAFVDPDVLDQFPSMMFSAIMDDRTTEICSNLDGNVYRSDDSIWNSITPPMHYSCRSTLIPVEIDDAVIKINFPKPDLSDVPVEFGGLRAA